MLRKTQLTVHIEFYIFQYLNHFIIICSIRIRHTGNLAAKHPFQILFIQENFIIYSVFIKLC